MSTEQGGMLIHLRPRVVKKLKRAFWLVKNELKDRFETEISAEIVSKIRPRWPDLLTILVWARFRWERLGELYRQRLAFELG